MTMLEIDREAVESYSFEYDPDNPNFGLIEGPIEHSQHQNQQKGLDLYVRVINFATGEMCFKKLYNNNKGLCFKHTGYPPTYLENMTAKGAAVPFQVFFE